VIIACGGCSERVEQQRNAALYALSSLARICVALNKLGS
jgi:hypothetical protein